MQQKNWAWIFPAFQLLSLQVNVPLADGVLHFDDPAARPLRVTRWWEAWHTWFVNYLGEDTKQEAGNRVFHSHVLWSIQWHMFPLL
jgi:hypothetical protein